MSGYTILLIGSGSNGYDRWEKTLTGGNISVRNVTASDLSISQFEPSNFDIMIVEASGREMEDTELCIGLRQRFDMPLLLVGSLPTESAGVAAYGAGVDECISSPVSDELLRAKVGVWLRWTRRSFVAQDSLSSIHADPQTARVSVDG